MPGRKKKKKSERECRGLHPYTIALAKESQRERERVCVCGTYLQSSEDGLAVPPSVARDSTCSLVWPFRTGIEA